MEALFFSIAAFLSIFTGGLISIKNRNSLHNIISFTAGVLIAVAFLEVIPEIFSIVRDSKIDINLPSMAIISGFFVIHILEKYVIIHHSHEKHLHDRRLPQVGMMSSAGLIFHSFLDGVGIGLGFHVSQQVGFLVALAVVTHGFSDGINTVSLMLLHKNTLKKALLFLVFHSFAPVLGALSTFLFKIPDNFLVIYLGFFAGFLLYIGASNLLPEAHSKESSWKMIALTIFGSFFVFIVSRFT